MDIVAQVVKLFILVWNREENTDKEMFQKRFQRVCFVFQQ